MSEILDDELGSILRVIGSEASAASAEELAVGYACLRAEGALEGVAWEEFVARYSGDDAEAIPLPTELKKRLLKASKKIVAVNLEGTAEQSEESVDHDFPVPNHSGDSRTDVVDQTVIREMRKEGGASLPGAPRE